MSQAAGPEPDSAAQPPAERHCIACGATISARAVLCPTCRSYQRSWKNNLAYFGSTAGFLAIVFSALTFMLTRANETYHAWQWHDEISVVYFEYPGVAGFINRGDGDLYLVSADIDWDGNRRHITVPLGITVPKGQFVSQTLAPYFPRPEAIGQGDWASGLLAGALPGLFAESSKDKDTARCAEFHFFEAPNTVFSRIDRILQSAGTGLLTAPAAGRLNVISVHTGQLLDPPPAFQDLRIAFLVVGPACKSANLTVTDKTFPRTGGGMGITESKPAKP